MNDNMQGNPCACSYINHVSVIDIKLNEVRKQHDYIYDEIEEPNWEIIYHLPDRSKEFLREYYSHWHDKRMDEVHEQEHHHQQQHKRKLRELGHLSEPKDCAKMVGEKLKSETNKEVHPDMVMSTPLPNTTSSLAHMLIATSTGGEEAKAVKTSDQEAIEREERRRHRRNT